MQNINTKRVMKTVGNTVEKVIVKAAETVYKVGDKPGKAALGLVGVAFVGNVANSIRKRATKGTVIRNGSTRVIKLTGKAILYGSLALVATIATTEISKKIGFGSYFEDKTDEDIMDNDYDELNETEEDEE